MFSKLEKASLMVSGLELLVIGVGFHILRKSIDETAKKTIGMTINEMMSARSVEEYKTLKN